MARVQLNNGRAWHTALWAVAGALLWMAGCGMNPDATYLYEMEKRFSQAERAMQTAGNISGLDEPRRLQLAASYQQVVDYYRAVQPQFTGGDLSPAVHSAQAIAVESSLRSAALLAGTAETDRALEIYRAVPADYPEATRYHPIARFELGRLFERGQKWDSAVAVYHDLLTSYRPPPDTVSGYDLDWLRLPLHIAEVYDQLELQPLAASWLDTGLIFYRRVRGAYPTGTTSVIARTNLATIHRLKGEFRTAIEVLRTITDSAGKVLPQVQVEIGDLFYERMKAPDSALAVFQELVIRQPDAPAATVAQTKIAAILIDRKEYEQAREILRPLKGAYEKKGQVIAGILLLLGRSYEQEGEWDRALNEYSWLVENFPGLRQSTEVSLHVIERMVAQDNLPVARQWQKQSRERFERLITQNPKSEQAAVAQTALARSFVLLQEWEDAARAYQALIDTYSPALVLPAAYLELSTVYAERLHDPARGTAVLEKLLSLFPALRAKDEVKARIDALKSRSS